MASKKKSAKKEPKKSEEPKIWGPAPVVLTLFEVLSKNQRVLVWSSEEDQVIITWNQSDTLQMWQYWLDGNWEEINIRTLSGMSRTVNHDLNKALDWMVGN